MNRFNGYRWAASAAALALAMSLGAGAQAATQQGKSRLGLGTQQQLQAARDAHQAKVTLLVAAQSGLAPSAAAAIKGLGAQVMVEDDTVDYLRVLASVDSVEAIAALASVRYVDIDQVVAVPDPRPDGIAALIPQPAPNAGTPRMNPYMPTQDVGAAQFVNSNPAWDGRGVTIGIVDTGVTLDHPALQTTSTGERKIVDWVTYTDPFTDDDPTWINMQAQVSGAKFTYQQVQYTAPYAGSFRIGLFNERDPRLGGELGNDVNRDGNPAGSSGLFAVLWDAKAGVVWVDTNQNGSFADEQPMRDYRINKDIGWFGTDNPATAVAERLPFVVQTDGKNKVVNIGIVSGAHGSHVAGITAANHLFGGAMSGAAPGAKIVSVRACLFIAGCTTHAMIEGMIYAVKQAGVDVINMSIGGLPALNDGNNARAEIYNRLIDRFNVQMFFSSGNDGPGLNTVGDPSVATRPVSVGAYVSKATHLANYGTVTAYDDNIHYFSSRGPREDGGFKPQILAPGSAISSTPMWQGGGGLASDLPPGYSMFNGTSMAAPQATGAAALLISAAKQTGRQWKPAQLRQAMMSSARLLTESNTNFDRMPISRQGAGLLDTNAAWNLLKTNIKTADISARVAVTTVISNFLATPNVGTGIYDREGVTAGQSYTRTYTLLRTSGSGTPVTYNVTWQGDTGSFSSAPSVSLPLNVPVQFAVTVNASTAGEHSAIMSLNDPASAGYELQTMNTVIASERFGNANNFAFATSGATLDRAQTRSYYFQVPPNTPAFRVDFSGPTAGSGTGQMRFLRWHPYGLGIDSNASSNCYVPAASAGCANGNPNSRTVANPLAGVWEVTVDARRTSDADGAPYQLVASVLGASVSPNPDVIASASAGVPIARSYTLTNSFGPFTGRAVGTTLGSASRGTKSIAGGAQQTFLVTVLPGSTSLRATIGSASDPAADLDLYVFNCTSGSCVQAGASTSGSAEESVTIANPAAGTWAVLVDGFAVPAGTTTYSYLDIFANPAFGAVSITDANALRASNVSWTVPGTVTANQAPASGRVLLGNVRVVTDTNVQVGVGDVVVQSVTP
jgi:subtilisin family serine protease